MVQKAALSTEGFYAPLGIWLEVHVYPGQEGISVYFRNITSRRLVEEKMYFLANYDALTGLPNRILLMDRLSQAIARASWHERVIGLLFCDLDRFKVINDTLGHAAGDHLLKEVATRFSHCGRPGDTVARLGGDEFVILLNDMAMPEDTRRIARKVIESISSPVSLDGHEIFVTVSIGISIFPSDGYDPNTLLKHADIAMYQAKERGKNTYMIYSPAMNAMTSKRLIMESALRRALERNEFRLHYQPIIDLKTSRLVAAEALIRWQHPESGTVSPANFLPLAEDTGLIVPIDQWVLRTACAQNKAWQDAGYPPIRISVNLSNQFFRQESITRIITRILHNTGLQATSLTLELTEGIIMQDLNRSTAILECLRSMGITLAIDDFGTGYSSLAHLKRFPIHSIKIDRSFIKQLCEDKNSCDTAITEAIIAIAHKLNLTVVAEGVETEEQRGFLTCRGCEWAQGFLISRPLPASDFIRFLDSIQG